MEVKNGIIIDGVLHEAINLRTIICYCDKCSLFYTCRKCLKEDCLCNIFGLSTNNRIRFISRGKVTNIEIEEETK